MNYVFQEYDAVIVLEDDCVTHPAFMTFMLQALNQYQNKKDVYSVSGYAYPVDVQSNGTDAYFTKEFLLGDGVPGKTDGSITNGIIGC